MFRVYKLLSSLHLRQRNRITALQQETSVNEKKKPMLLTLWNEFEQNQGTHLANSIGNANVINGMKLKITTFNYLSLTTKPGSGLLINPPTSEANALKEWIRIGITVDDSTGSINTVIFGLDAENLIPFIALQFSEAHNEELNFSAELASAIRKHSIVCFIHYYVADYQGQKECKYNIVKAYTTEESIHILMAITTAKTNEKIPDLHATVLQSAKKNEFFNPSTKKLLDTIVESSATTNKMPSPVTTAKRTLVFGTVPSEIGLNFAKANTSTLLPTNAPGSPLKK